VVVGMSAALMQGVRGSTEDIDLVFELELRAQGVKTPEHQIFELEPEQCVPRSERLERRTLIDAHQNNKMLISCRNCQRNFRSQNDEMSISCRPLPRFPLCSSSTLNPR
jgi:hypothetical protein